MSMLSQLRGLRVLVLCTFLLGVVAAAVNAVQPVLLRRVLDSLRSISISAVVLLVLVLVTYTVLSSVEEYLRARVTNSVTAGIRKRLAAHVCDVPLSAVDRYPKGDLLARLGDDAAQIGTALDQGVLVLFASVFGFVFAFAGMLLIDAVLLVSVLVFVAVGTVLSVAMSRTLSGASLDVQNANGEMVTVFDRLLTGLPLLKAYNAESLESAKVSRFVDRHYARAMRLVVLQSVVKPLGGIVVQLALLASLGVGVYRVSTGALTIGGLVAFALYLTMITSPVTQVIDGVAAFRSGKGAMGRVEEILSIGPEAPALPAGSCQPGEARVGASVQVGPDTGTGSGEVIRFDAVTYRYEDYDDRDPADRFVLGPITFSITRGSRTAIVGQSGSGKSTVLSLVERFRSPSSGAITVLGREQSEYRLAAYRDNFAYVDQGSVALGGTLRENLVVARQQVSESEVRSALSSVGLDHLVDRLDTDLGDSGMRLSGGERQRVSWARLLLNRHRPIVLLDEPASSVDSLSARLLSDILDSLPEESAVLMVTHTLSQIELFDQVIVLEHGRLVGCGTHEEMLLRVPGYRNMAARQGVLPAEGQKVLSVS